MSLDWDCENCERPLPDNDEESALRTGLIWASLGLDLGSITEKNVDEWVFRLIHQKRVGLEYIYIDDDISPVQVEGWVRRWIGMRTNVITKTRKQWLSAVSALLERDTLNAIKHSKEDAAV